ncbi:MAG: hypothetical protein J7515_00965 [Caulobacter sp.]|nr:hypothetical protein [Caulobacter sp.]
MEPSKNKITLIAGVATAGIITTAALAMAAWPALTRPDPPSEASGDDGLRIRLVQPPKAMVASVGPSAGPLEVGLSEAAQAMAKGREALFVRPPAVTPRPRPTPVRYTPAQVAQTEEDDEPPPKADERWERDRPEPGYELARQRWEDERQARIETDRRLAWEREQRERRRWEEARERERYDERRYDDRYAPPPPPEDDRPPPPDE